MNKLNSLLLITLLTVSSFNCLEPANIKEYTSLAEIYADDFGSNVLSLLSIHAMTSDGMDDLNAVIEEIRQHILDEGETDTASWGVEHAQLQTIVDTNTEQYGNSAAAVEYLNSLLDTTRTQLGDLTSQLDMLNDNRADLLRRIETHNAMVITETAAYEQRQEDDTYSIQACNDAIEIIRRFPDLDQAEQGTFFVQINDKISEVQTTLKSKARRDNQIYLPLVSALTSLVQTNTVSPQACMEIIGLLEQLRDSIVSAQASDQVNHGINLGIWTQTSEDMATQSQTLNDNIDTTTYQIQNMRSLIDDTERYRDAEVLLRDACYVTYTTTQQTLDYKQADFDDRELIRGAQLILLDDLQSHVQGDMQGAYDELEALF